MKGPNAFEMVGDAIPAGGFELGVARYRGGFIPVAFQPGANPIPLSASATSISEAETALRLILRGVKLAEQGR